MSRCLGVLLAAGLLTATPAIAGKADVVFVDAVQEDAETWHFAVTVRHDDRDPEH